MTDKCLVLYISGLSKTIGTIFRDLYFTFFHYKEMEHEYVFSNLLIILLYWLYVVGWSDMAEFYPQLTSVRFFRKKLSWMGVATIVVLRGENRSPTMADS